MEQITPGAICMDCALRDEGATRESNGKIPPGQFCEHWRPEYWEARGYVRGWGDAAVMNWPQMEILRKEERTDSEVHVRFVILAPYALRRPVVIFATAGLEARFHAWGAY